MVNCQRNNHEEFQEKLLIDQQQQATFFISYIVWDGYEQWHSSRTRVGVAKEIFPVPISQVISFIKTLVICSMSYLAGVATAKLESHLSNDITNPAILQVRLHDQLYVGKLTNSASVTPTWQLFCLGCQAPWRWHENCITAILPLNNDIYICRYWFLAGHRFQFYWPLSSLQWLD